MTLDDAAGNALMKLSGLHTLTDHLHLLRSYDGRFSLPSKTAELIATLITKGLLVSEAELLSFRKTDKHATAPPSIDRMIVATCDRPASLQRLLSSFSRSTQAASSRFSIYACDDSRDAGNLAANKRLLTNYARQSGQAVYHCDRRARRSLLKTIRRQTAISEVALEAMIGVSEGYCRSEAANRNAGLILCGGTRFVTVDDDTTFNGVCPNISAAAPIFSSSRQGISCSFMEGDGMSDMLSGEVQLDILSKINSYLGQPLCAYDLSEVTIDEVPASSNLWHDLVRGDGSVIMVQLGLLGNSGRSLCDWVLPAILRSPKGTSSPRQSLKTAINCRHILEMPSKAIISDSKFCMSFGLGLDGTTLLPPFLPCGRNADGLFGALIKAIHRDGYTAFVPAAICHLNDRTMGSDIEATWNDAAVITEADILLKLMELTETRSSGIGDASAALLHIGQYFASLAHFNEAQFGILCESLIRKELAGRMRYYKKLSKTSHTVSDDWVSSVENARQIASASISQNDRILRNGPERLKLSRDGLKTFSRFVSTCGEILSIWPEVYSAGVDHRVIQDIEC